MWRLYFILMDKKVTSSSLTSIIAKAELQSSALAVHSSLNSFGYLEGGAQTLIAAFLDAECTLLAPAFTYGNQVAVQREIPQNGSTPRLFLSREPEWGFDPQNNEISKSMGAIPAAILGTPRRARGEHPLNSFTTAGPLSEEIISKQAPLDVYGPYKMLYRLPRSYVLLIGVDLTTATPIHYAEERAGRRLFRRWGKYMGRTVECQVGSCSAGFNHLLPMVKPVEQLYKVGKSLWRLYPFREFIDLIASAIQSNPTITRCQEPGCGNCADAARGGPLLSDD
jgi:aminoglycoside 3-N-acetyltransferase